MEDKLMKMSEYAESRGVSYEGVRRKVIRNYDKLNLCKKVEQRILHSRL